MRTRDASKQDLIRRKALEMLVRDGLDGFSMQKLARASRVSPATLYIYFKDRDDLIFQLYKENFEEMTEESLNGFDPQSSFADGLRVQWKNRARYCLAHPLEAQFLEQVRHSPYFENFFSRIDSKFSEQMSLFARTAIARKELVPMSREMFWSLAYAPLYQMIKFHQNGFGFRPPAWKAGEKKFALDDQVLEAALRLVLKAFKP
jgi:AcrR family transcriptional regulator